MEKKHRRLFQTQQNAIHKCVYIFYAYRAGGRGSPMEGSMDQSVRSDCLTGTHFYEVRLLSWNYNIFHRCGGFASSRGLQLKLTNFPS